ncbi:interleukin-17C isoform X2 [Solea solea]|uniref:interleukin-17C isoform X2 n=1 Tax=Solea solea TaxID=90069 RepID=UPI0027297CA7|nr:interleukin-17C isoform X2 [Solea solea]
MDLKQIFIIIIIILGLLLAPVWTFKMNRCYDDDELSDAADRKLRSHFLQPPEPSAVEEEAEPSSSSCPVSLYQQRLQEMSDRSVSPWRYVLRHLKDHYPSSYAEARCLCSGCILIRDRNPPTESLDYNSVPIKQSRIFLKRELCSDGQKYHLTPVNVEVAVGCTCVRVKTSTSS